LPSKLIFFCAGCSLIFLLFSGVFVRPVGRFFSGCSCPALFAAGGETRGQKYGWNFNYTAIVEIND
jgi:hypothetical protein